MYRVRYYDRAFHPDYFRDGYLGWCIRVLNNLRWKLEVMVQGLVVRYLSRGMGGEEKKAVLKRFERDVAGERLEKVISSPLLNPTIPPAVVEEDEPSGVHVVDSSAGRRVAEDGILGVIERYAPKGRSSRYSGKPVIWGDPDGDFEAVDKPEKTDAQ